MSSSPDKAQKRKSDESVRSARRMLKVIFHGRHLLARNEICPVRNREELNQAQRLLSQKTNILNSDRDDWASVFLTAFSILKTTTTLISQTPRGDIVGASALVGDGVLGLPADSIFRAELGEMRSAGFSMVEISGITLESSFFNSTRWSIKTLRSLSAMMGLLASVFRYAYEHQFASHLVVTATSSTKKIFELVGFESCASLAGSLEAGESVELMVLDIDGVLGRCHEDIASLCLVAGFGKSVPKKSYQLDSIELTEIARRSPEIFRAMSHAEVEAIAADFPIFRRVLQMVRTDVSTPTYARSSADFQMS